MKSQRHTDVSNDSESRTARVLNGDKLTRDLLIQAALKLFARYGFDGVSLRQISAEAQQLNQSVVHYYFQSKKGLIDAVLDYVAAQLLPMQLAGEENIREIAKLRPPTVREIVTAAMMPIVTWYAFSEVGRRSLRFLSRLTWQADQEEFELLVKRCLPFYDSLVDHVHAVQPGVRREVIAAKVLFSIINLLHGLASTRVALFSKELAARGGTELDPAVLLEHFIDFVAAGLSSSRPEG